MTIEAAPVLWDLIIVGAGPAGCAAAARALQQRPDAKILLLDKAAFPRDKTCGDGIAAAAIDLLAELGLDRASVTAGFVPVNEFRVRSPAGVSVARTMRDPVWVIPRMIFDHRLVAAVQARGATLVRHAVRSVEDRGDHVVVDATFRGRIVIGADGAESLVRRALAHPPNRPASMAIAIRGYGEELPGQDGAQLITMTAKQWPAYAWSFPIGAGRANIGFGQLLGAGTPSRAQLLTSLQELLPGCAPDPTTLRAHRLPLSTSRPPIASGRVMLVGDAQSLINPLTGEGIFYALVSGALAGGCAVAGPGAAAAYRRALTDRLGRHLRHSTALAFVTRWPRLMDSVLRGAVDSQPTFDDLVAIGLDDGTLTPRLVRAALRPQNWLGRDDTTTATLYAER